METNQKEEVGKGTSLAEKRTCDIESVRPAVLANRIGPARVYAHPDGSPSSIREISRGYENRN
jgi:hypothetical protein